MSNEDQNAGVKRTENLKEDLSWFQKTLEGLLEPGEKLYCQLEGMDLSGLVCTDRRVIIFHTGHFTWMMGDVKTFQARYSQIRDVALIEHSFRGIYVFEVVTAEAKGGATLAGGFWRFASEPNRVAFVKDKAPQLEATLAFVKAKVAEAPPLISPTPEPVADQPTVVQRLKQLAELKADGILSEEEFVQQKQKLVERL